MKRAISVAMLAIMIPLLLVAIAAVAWNLYDFVEFLAGRSLTEPHWLKAFGFAVTVWCLARIVWAAITGERGL
jgi:hypothetical protein